MPADCTETHGPGDQSTHAHKPPSRIPRRQDFKWKLSLLTTPHSVAVSGFYLQPICSGRQLRKPQFSLRGLGPGRIRALQPVTKNNPVFTGSIRCGVSCDERV